MRIAVTGSLLLVVLVTACGGGGANEPRDLGGWYEFAARTGGTSAPFVATSVAQIEDLGEAFWLAGRRYDLVEGVYVSLDPGPADPDRFERRWWVAGDGRLEGRYENFVSGTSLGTLDVRLLRTTAPDGLLTLVGTLGGEAVDVDSPNAHGLDGVSGGELSLSLQAAPSRFSCAVTFAFTATPAPDLGTWTVGTDPGTVRVYLAFGSTLGIASDGTVSLTALDADRAAGTYAVTVDGRPCTGTFDLPILLHVGS